MCNLDCSYCSNYRYLDVCNTRKVDTDFIMSNIVKSAPYIDAVVFSGGEPLLQYAAIKGLVKKIHKMGLLAGVQTNGTMPINTLDGFDAIMLDIKAPLKFYNRVCEKPVNINRIRDSIKHIRELKKKSLQYWECRTVVFKGLNDNIRDLARCYSEVPDCDRYYVSRGSGAVYKQPFEEVLTIELIKLASQLRGNNVYVRASGETKVGGNFKC
jgi:pyruvate formate lyase activating enzyme